MIEITATIIGILGAILLTIAYVLIQYNHISSNSKTYNYLNLFGSFFILYSLFFQWNTGAALIELTWAIITIHAILRRKERNQKNKLGNLNAQYENLNDEHYLKYFNNYDIDYNVGIEFNKIFKFNLASASSIPFFVKLFENPKYKWFLPSIFKGRVDLKQHDFIHLLMSRGFNIVDEIAVIGVSMGSTKKMNWFNVPLFYILQWIFYDKNFRFPIKYYTLFKMYIRFGENLTKNLSKIDIDDWNNYQMSELRKEFGIFKEDLIEILKVEVLEFGINGRMLEGLEINSKELMVLEENTKEIVVYSPFLRNDLLEPNIINTVSYNLNNGVNYKYIIPNKDGMIAKKGQLLDLHKNHVNLSIIVIDVEDYMSKYDQEKEYVYYDNIIYIVEEEKNKFIIYSV